MKYWEKVIYGSLCIFLLLSICTCSPEGNSPEGKWIKGDNKFEIIEKQFRGFDAAMVEVGYRYQELFWAAKDTNWEYATYQSEKLLLAIENGLVRRPNRAKSAQHFITVSLPELDKAISKRDSSAFFAAFKVLTSNCNSCHIQEKVSFFKVSIPQHRQSPVY